MAPPPPLRPLAEGSSRSPIPPYYLEPCLFPAIPPDEALSSPDPNSPAGLAKSQSRAVRCTEGDANNLYVGTSDGTVHAYSVIVPPQGSSRNSRPRYRLRMSRLVSNHAKPVEKILLLAQLSLAAVLCEGVLSFYTLPDWTPARGLPSTRAVTTAVLDDDEVDNNDGTDGMGMVSLCIIRRKNILLAKVGQNESRDPVWVVIKDLPLPGGAIVARRHGDALCVANTTEYSLVNLSDGLVTQLHLPISQTGESPSAQVRPSIVSIPIRQGSDGPGSVVARPSSGSVPKCEFLITSHSGAITLGVFVTPSGEPTPKLLEWPSHPRSLVYTSNYLFSLLRNDTLEVYDIRDEVMEKVQTQHLPPGVEPRFLTSVPAELAATGNSRQIEGGFDDLDIVKLDLDAPSTSASLLKRHERNSPLRVRRNQILLGGRNSAHVLDQDSLLDWGTALLKRGQLSTLHEGLDTVQEQLRERAESGIKAETAQHQTLSQHSLLMQALTLEELRRARFWHASETFSKSGGDPRLLISLFSDLGVDGCVPSAHLREDSTVALGRPKKEAIVPALLLRHLERLMRDDASGFANVSTLVHNNLTQNYCPPLDADKEPVLDNLSSSLSRRASDMLLVVLRAWRTQAAVHREIPETPTQWAGAVMDDLMRERVNAEVDRTLLAVLSQRSAEGVAASELDGLLDGELACPVEDVVHVLRQRSYFSKLASLYQKDRRWDNVLDIWTGIIDGRIADRGPAVSSRPQHVPTVADVASLLSQIDEPSLVSKYSTWLVRKDPEAGVQILMKQAATVSHQSEAAQRSTKEKEVAALEGQRATLNELSSIDQKAADGFLENVVLAATKIQDAELHMRLFDVLFRRVEESLVTAEVRTRHQDIAADYIEGSFAESFFAHLALAASAHVEDLDRLKLATLLQGSTVLDFEAALKTLGRVELLVYERAILLGKLGRDRDALHVLAIELRDANSAEAYCSQDGAVLSPMLVSAIGEDLAALRPYAAMVARTHNQRNRAAARLAHKDGTRARLRKEELLKALLTIYMENGSDQKFRTATAHLLNTQALHLDSLEILSLVPDQWPLSTLETFLAQSLRRQRHRRAEAEMTKSIALCREFDVAEDVWARLRAMGGVLQDTDDVDDAQEGPNRALQSTVSDHEAAHDINTGDEKLIVEVKPPVAPATEAVHEIDAEKGNQAVDGLGHDGVRLDESDGLRSVW